MLRHFQERKPKREVAHFFTEVIFEALSRKEKERLTETGQKKRLGRKSLPEEERKCFEAWREALREGRWKEESFEEWRRRLGPTE